MFLNFVVWLKKLDHNSGQHAKNQREISLVIKSEGFLVFQGENAEKGGNGIRREGNGLLSPDLPQCPKNAGKMRGGNYFLPTLVFDSETRWQFWPAWKKSERNL